MRDWLLSRCIDCLNLRRLRYERRGGAAAQQARLMALLEDEGPLAVAVEEANRQHYEVPARFFQLVLGPHLKYSSACWPPGCCSLGSAEEAMLALSCQRAELEVGQRVLELGCGWGSLTAYMARRLALSRLLAVSNSASQREFIQGLELPAVEVRTCDINSFSPEERFDRIVSVEMFEHLRNYRLLFRRLREWLLPGGKLFVHVFCHRTLAYRFEGRGWMERHFFAGGSMPAASTLLQCGSLELEEHWLMDGTHYERTALAWLANLRLHRREVLRLFREVYGARQAGLWFRRWELFFLACARLFGLRGGQEYLVGHYRFRR